MNYPVVELTEKSEQYPKMLRHIADPPARLYCRGNLSLLNTECFAVVGSRAITAYGKEVVRHIIPSLARHFTIVSGMAIGIDGSAHRATLDCAGQTIAVLGSGIDDKSIYPSINHRLGQDILKSGGLIISEYKPGTKARDYMFPERNRIVSGLSKGVLIIEADEKSGSLITAKSAGEQNRDVFAVPGSIFSTKSGGPHKLIGQGAKLVVSAKDILDEYSLLPLDKNPTMSTADPTHSAILAILETHGPLNIDGIIEQSGQNAPEIMAALSMMEIKGLVTQMASGIFRKSD